MLMNLVLSCVFKVLPENNKRLQKDMVNQALKDRLGTATKPPTVQGAAGGAEEMDDGMNGLYITWFYLAQDINPLWTTGLFL